MAQSKPDNILNTSPKHDDDKTGVFQSGVWRPYNNIAEYTARFPTLAARAETQSIYVRSTDDANKADLYLLDLNKAPYLFKKAIDVSGVSSVNGRTGAVSGLAEQSALTAGLASKADLVGGTVPANQLPSYVDDVVDFANVAAFPVTGSASIIYVAVDTNKTYRWAGSSYVPLGEGVALGETGSTAYRGDRGKVAYDWVQAHPKVENVSPMEMPVSTAQAAAIAAAAGGGGGGGGSEFPRLPVNAVRTLEFFGTSIEAGYLLPDPYAAAWPIQFATRVGIPTTVNRAESATNCFKALRQAYTYMPLYGNRTNGYVVGMGFNDHQTASLEKDVAKVEGCLNSFLANAFAKMAYAGSDNSGYFTKTGTWTAYDSASHGGKAATLVRVGNASPTALKTNQNGATFSINVDVFSGTGGISGFVIGTYGEAGTTELGGFTVSVDDIVVGSYDPANKTNGATDITGYDNSITPYAVFVDYPIANGDIITITSNSTKLLIVDYIIGLERGDVTLPVFVSAVSKRSGADADSLAKTAAMNAMLGNVVKYWVKKGFPVTFVDVNVEYNPDTDTNPPMDMSVPHDGIHPNKIGAFKFASAAAAMALGGVIGSPIPKVASGEKIVTSTPAGTMLEYDPVESHVAATALTAADFSTGTAAVTGITGQKSSDANYLYECIGTNQWARLPKAYTAVDLYAGTIDDSGGDKTSAELQTAFSAAVIGQRVRGVNNMYEKYSSSNWIKSQIEVA